MPIAEWNKDNPLVIIMRSRLIYLDRLSLDTMKYCIVNCVYSITIVILYLMLRVPINICLVYFIWIFSINYYNFTEYIKTKMKSRFKDASDVLMGDAYQNVFVNDEDILHIIENENRAIGVFVAMQSILRIEVILISAGIVGFFLK